MHENPVAGDAFQARHVGKRAHERLGTWRLLVSLKQSGGFRRREMRFGIGRGVEGDADDDTRLGAVSQGFRDD
jgi:hypothetical protein